MTILYHYTSNAAFHSILTSRSIWLQALALSNDFMEGRLASQLILEFARKDGMRQYDIDVLRTLLQGIEGVVEGMGFCLSEDGDVLSQWRGYASDGRGIAIGFSRASLERLARSPTETGGRVFSVQRVEYDPREQEELLRPFLETVKPDLKVLVDEALSRSSLLPFPTEEAAHANQLQIKETSTSVFQKLGPMLDCLYRLKAKAFSEEREWRLLAHGFRLSGTSPDKYRATRECIVPYREIAIPAGAAGVVSEVILGPKNRTPVSTIKSFAKACGFDDVRVMTSEASYR